MTKQKPFEWGVVAGMLLILGADALHWFITPMQHPDASTMMRLAMGAQAVVGIGGGVWLIMRQRARSSVHRTV